MDAAARTVFYVNDTGEDRTALLRLLTSVDYQVRTFESAERFLEEQDAERPGCMLVDICLPGMSGLDLQRSLVGSLRARSIVFLSGTSDINTAVNAMKQGAVDYLTTPIDELRLLAAVEEALQRDAEQRQERAIRSAIRQRVATLTRCEREVMMHVIRGLLNKHIAVEVGAGEKTVKVHRMRVMRKMGVGSVAELVRLTARVGVS
jgi:FixJ family two-component response regulator